MGSEASLVHTGELPHIQKFWLSYIDRTDSENANADVFFFFLDVYLCEQA